MGKEQELLEAARNGAVSIVEKILNHRTKISGPLASLRRGPGPNTQDSFGYTCLHYAALNEHTNVVILLLKHDANPNIVDKNGSTALHLASWRGNYDIVSAILTRSSTVPNVNLKNNLKEIPLHSAAQYGYTRVVSLLLQHGSDPLIRNHKLESPLDLASLYGRYETVNILLRNSPSLIHDLVEKHSPLHLAAQNGHRDVAQLLLNAKFNVNYVTEKGTALHVAALSCKVDVIELLINYGVDIELENSKKQTVLNLLDELQTNTNITKKIKHIIKEHSTLVKTEDDSSTVINSSSIISPPLEYSNDNENQTTSINQKWPLGDCLSSANSDLTFYDLPSLPRASLAATMRSSGASDEYRTPRSSFSRSQESILDGYSTSSSRSPSFTEGDTGHPIPRERLSLTRNKSLDSPHSNYPLTVYQQSFNTEDTTNYGSMNRNQYANTSVKNNSQSFNGTWNNHSTKTVKPPPPAKPPRKPVIMSQTHQHNSSSKQPQLSVTEKSSELNESIYRIISNKDGSLKRSKSAEDEAYSNSLSSSNNINKTNATFFGSHKNSHSPICENNLLSESPFSALYDQIANEPLENEPKTVETDPRFDNNNTQLSKKVTLQRHTRSKSVHHPYCPNFGQTVNQHDKTSDSSNFKNLSNSNLFENIHDPPSAATAEEGISSLISSIFQKDDLCDKACPLLINGQPHPIINTHNFEHHSKNISDYQSDSCSSNESQEYKRINNKDCSDNETCTDESLFPLSGDTGKKIYVKLRHKGNKSASKATDFDSLSNESKDNLFEGLLLGSLNHRKSTVSLDDHRSVRKGKTTDKSISEKRKKMRSSKSKSAIIVKHDNHEMNKTVIEIKPSDTNSKINYTSDSSGIIKSDQNKEWADIAGIISSSENTVNGNNIEMSKRLNKTVESWLIYLNLEKYSHLLIDNGFDDIRFMNVIEDSDLLEIGLSNEEDRKKLLSACSKLPKIKTIDKNSNLKVDEWLMSINLFEYYERFKTNEYTNMDKICQIWEIELDTVLKITKIGHRKRILASLEERMTILNELGFDLDLNKLSFKSLSLEEESNEGPRRDSEVNSSFSELSGNYILADYESDAVSVSSDTRTDYMGSNFSLNKNTFQTFSSPWKHDPNELYQGHCDYKANYLGVTLVTRLQGIQSSQEAIKRIKEARFRSKEESEIIISISCSGVKYINANTNEMLCEHEIRNIHCACQGAQDLRDFAYITKDVKKNAYFCHVFTAQTLDLSNEIILTLGQAFQIVYQMTVDPEKKSLSDDKSIVFKPPSPPPRTTSYTLSQHHMPNVTKMKLSDYVFTPSSTQEAKKSENLWNNVQDNCSNNKVSRLIMENNLLNSSSQVCDSVSKVEVIKKQKPISSVKPNVPRKPDYLIKSSTAAFARKVK